MSDRWWWLAAVPVYLALMAFGVWAADLLHDWMHAEWWPL